MTWIKFKKKMPTCGKRDFKKYGYSTIEVKDDNGTIRDFHFTDEEILEHNVKTLNLQEWRTKPTN